MFGWDNEVCKEGAVFMGREWNAYGYEWLKTFIAIGNKPASCFIIAFKERWSVVWDMLLRL